MRAHSRRFRAALKLAAALLLLLGIAGWLLVTSDRFEDGLRARLQAEMLRALGPRASIGEVTAEPLRLGLRVSDVDLAIGERGSRITIDRLSVRLDLWSLLERRPGIRRLVAEGASIVLDLDDPALKGGGGRTGLPDLSLLGRVQLTRTRVELRSSKLAVVIDDLSGTLAQNRRGDVDLGASFDLETLTFDERSFAPGHLSLSLRKPAAGPLELHELRGDLRTGPLEARGSIVLEPLEFNVDLKLTANTSEITQVFGGSDELRGPARVVGKLAGPLERLRFQGELSATEIVAVNDVPLEEIRATLVAGPSGARLSAGEAGIFGGRVRFTAAAPFHGAPPRLEFQLSDLDLRRVRSRLPAFPLASGRLSGPGTLQLGDRRGPTTLRAEVTAGEVVASARETLTDPWLHHMLSPFSGTAQVTLVGGVVHVAGAELASEWTAARAEGSFDLRGPIRARVEIEGAQLAPVSTLAGPAFPWLAAPSRFRLDGLLDGVLDWGGTASQPSYRFSGSGRSVLLEGPDPGAGGARAALDEFRLDVTYIGDLIEWRAAGRAAGGDPGRIEASGEVRVRDQGRPAQKLLAVAEQWSAPVAAALVGLPFAVSGTLQFRADLHDEGGGFQGSVSIQGPAGPAGRGVDQASIELELGPTTTAFRSLRLASGSGHLELSGSLADRDGRLELEARAVNFPLRALLPDPALETEGVMSGALRARGIWPEGIETTGELRLEALHLAGLPLEDFAVRIAGRGRQFTLQLGREPEVQATAEVSLLEPYPFSAEARLGGYDLRPLLAALARNPRAGSGGELDGRITLRGALGARPAIEQAEARIDRLRISAPGLEVRAERPFEIKRREDGRYHLRGLELLGAQTALRIDGETAGPRGPFDLHLSGLTDLRLVRALLPDLQLAGSLALEARLTGDLDTGRLEGSAELKNGYYRSPALPYPLRDVHAQLRFSGRGATLEQLTARFGGGRIDAEGSVELVEGGEPRIRVHASGTGVELRLLRDLELRGDPDVIWEAGPEGRSLRGTLHLSRAVYRSRAGLAGGDAAAWGTSPGSPALEGFPETRLDLEIVAEGNLWYDSPEARLEGDALLRIAGTSMDPTVLGSVRYLSQDRLKVEGRHYRVLRGSLVFDRPRELDPRIDFEAETALSGYDIVLGLTGRMSNPQVTARSDPPLAQNDVLALLLGGRPAEGHGVVGPTGGGEIFRSLFLPQAVGRLTSGRVLIDPTALSARTDPTEVLPLIIPLSSSFDVTLGVPLREARPGLFVLNWRPWRSVALSAIRDFDRGWGSELVLERRFGSSTTPAETGPPVRSVSARAVAGISERELLGTVRVEKGDRLNRRELRDDSERIAHRLAVLGHPLAEVGPAVLLDPDTGTAAIEWAIEPGPRVQIDTPGQRFSRGERRRLLDTVRSYGLSSETGAELERVGRELLETRGHPEALVSCELDGPPEVSREAVRVECDIEAGPRARIKEVRILGSSQIPESKLKDVLSTRVGPFSRKRLVAADVEDDVRRLTQLLREEGFLDAEVRAEVLPHGDPGKLDLLFHIEEGNRWSVGSVQVTGNDVIAPPPTLIRGGAPARGEDLRRSRNGLLAALDALGYMDASVRAEIKRDEPNHQIAVTYHVTSGVASRVGTIRIEGLKRTRSSVVRRELRFAPGGLLSYERLSESQRRLLDTGIFRLVEIRPEPREERSIRDVVIQVEEGRPYRLKAGGGYDSDEGPRAIAEISDTNFMGRGRFLGLQSRVGAKLRRGQLLFREPRPFGLELPTLFATYYEDREEVSFNLRRLVFRTEASRVFGRRVRNRAALRYSLADTRLSRLQVSPLEAGAEDIRISSLGASLSLDARDDVLEPRRGSLLSADLEWATGWLASEADFLKATLKAHAYLPLGRRLVWAMGGVTGLSYVPGPAARLPLAERYFAGGATSLRGLGFNLAGPKDPATGKPTGGNILLILNQELRYDLFRSLVVTLFVDAGNVFRTIEEVSLRGSRIDVGAGLRYRGPVLAGIDYAWLLDAEPGESRSQLHFSLGYAF